MARGYARGYDWARRTIPRGHWAIGDVAFLLGVGRHAARRRLLKSGLPARLITRYWRYGGYLYRRKAWAVPGLSVAILFAESQRALLRRAGKTGCHLLRKIECQLAELRSHLTQHTDNPR